MTQLVDTYLGTEFKPTPINSATGKTNTTWTLYKGRLDIFKDTPHQMALRDLLPSNPELNSVVLLVDLVKWVTACIPTTQQGPTEWIQAWLAVDSALKGVLAAHKIFLASSLK